jgi:phosphoglucosamine mutase
MRGLFGTDGVRGVAGRDLTPELVRALGRAAVGVVWRRGRDRPSIVLGRDTRESGEWISAELAAGAVAAGGDVLDAGVVTTPAVAFLTVELGASSGAMISASHNPPEYNGIKLFGPGGFKLPDEVEADIESALDREPDVGAGLPGAVHPLTDGSSRYLEHLVEGRPSLSGMSVVVDCANGAASRLAPEALRRLGAKVRAIHDCPDGRNINLGCGAMHPEVVAREVVETGADAGVAHDGDADRALFSDAEGRIVDGDQVLAACAIGLREEGRLRSNTVVTTVMANLGFHRAMREAGIEVLSTKVGDRYVLEEMVRVGAVVGGEQSGHLIFRDHATTGDGILTAIELLGLAARRGATVSELASSMRRYPQVLRNVEVSDPSGLEGASSLLEAVAAAEKALGEDGRVLVRASGTEPVVRVMVEAESDEEAGAYADEIAGAVRRELG